LDFIDLVMVRRGISAWVGEVLPVAVDALVASDRSVEAESLVRDVERELRGRDAPLANAGLSWTRGVIAANQTRYSVAADAFGRAEREFACLPRPYDSARALERRGLCLVAVIDASAADSLGGALQRFRRLGARADFNRVRRTLRAHSFPVPAAERTPAVQGMALTRQETEVVRRAAVGLTASEISSELSLSQRTVEQYLRFAIRKLGVDRKRDLVGRADLLDTGRRPAAKPK
jgi:DNA-binding CsgD family transcriptional regulator